MASQEEVEIFQDFHRGFKTKHGLKHSLYTILYLETLFVTMKIGAGKFLGIENGP